MFKTIVKWFSIALLVGCTIQAASFTVGWDRPLTYEDNSVLLPETILIYEVHWGTTQCPPNVYPHECSYTNTEPGVNQLTTQTFTAPSDGKLYYITVTARTLTSPMSRYSNEISIQTVNMIRPNQPTNMAEVEDE